MLGIWCLGGDSIMCWSLGEPTRGLSSELVWDDVLMPCGPERPGELQGACRQLHWQKTDRATTVPGAPLTFFLSHDIICAIFHFR